MKQLGCETDLESYRVSLAVTRRIAATLRRTATAVPETKVATVAVVAAAQIYTTIGGPSSKVDEFLAEPSQFDSDHGVDLYTPTSCQSATFVRPLFAFYFTLFFTITKIMRHFVTDAAMFTLRDFKPGLHSVRHSTKTEMRKRIYADTRVMAFIHA